MKGIFGKILTINLTDEQTREEELSESIYRNYLGGKGLASHLLLERNPAGVDPLSPDNLLVFAGGPACGFVLWGANRYGAFTKSPLTGVFSEAYSGGKAFLQLTRTGYDAILLDGAHEEWTVLEVSAEAVRFRDASSLMGMDAFETERALIEQYKEEQPKSKTAVLTIGPGGEKLVKYAYINNDFGRCLGRTGVGAVMGSKRIKAIVFIGSKDKTAADPGLIREFNKEQREKGKTDKGVAMYHDFGTSQVVNFTTKTDSFPARYWSEGNVAHADKINGEAMHRELKVKPTSCLYCFISCSRDSEVLSGRHEGLKLDGPEYETINAFGGLNLVDDIREIAYLNDICDRLGIDTITAGNTTAFAIEAYKAGKIDYQIDYNDVDRIAELLRMIAYREGIGDLLAEGTRAAAKKLGMEDRAIHVKGLEPPGYDPRVLQGMGLGYAVSDRGACHLRTTFYKPELAGLIDPQSNEGKAEMFLEYEDRLTIYDTLILCRFFRDMYLWDELSTILKGVMGLDYAEKEMRQVSKRIAMTIREFNLREGMSCDEDFLPDWFFDRPVGSKHITLTKEHFAELVDDYYRLRGFSRT
ncbi:MAG: aldehyde ferredoxin oxidoreductase family protein [Spirochaetaceae bacterium]